MRYLAPFLLLVLTGCRSGIPSHIQPEEYAVYRAFITDYATKHPSVVGHLYVRAEVSGSAFFPGERHGRKGSYSHCISQEADNAFWKVNTKRYSLDHTHQDWRTLPNSTVIPLFAVPRPIPFTSISFSRVFFDKNGRDAYFRANVGYCDPGCGGYGIVWHAVRASENWTFDPTICHGES